MIRRTRTLIWAPLLVVAIAGCSGDAGDYALSRDNNPDLHRMPSVELVHTSTNVDLSPRSVGSRIRVSTDGSVLLEEPSDAGLMMLVVDSSGQERFRFGAPGDGPGELQRALPYAASPATATVADLGKLRLMTFDTTGALIGEQEIPSIRAQPIVDIDDDHALAMTLGPDGVFPATIDLTSGKVQELMTRPDSFVESMGSTGLGGTATPTFGIWRAGLLIADPATYRIALYDTTGTLVRVLHRDVDRPRMSEGRADAMIEMFRLSPPGARATDADIERRRAELLGNSLDHFKPLVPLMIDEADRLWVIGPSGDSAYADVFSTDTHLGRLELPCNGADGGWSINGRWLAMSCAPTDSNYSGDAVLKLFRIR